MRKSNILIGSLRWLALVLLAISFVSQLFKETRLLIAYWRQDGFGQNWFDVNLTPDSPTAANLTDYADSGDYLPIWFVFGCLIVGVSMLVLYFALEYWQKRRYYRNSDIAAGRTEHLPIYCSPSAAASLLPPDNDWADGTDTTHAIARQTVAIAQSYGNSGEIAFLGSGVVFWPNLILTAAHLLPKDKNARLYCHSETVTGRAWLPVIPMMWDKRADIAVFGIVGQTAPCQTLLIDQKSVQPGEMLGVAGCTRPSDEARHYATWCEAGGDKDMDFIAVPGNSGSVVFRPSGKIVGVLILAQPAKITPDQDDPKVVLVEGRAFFTPATHLVKMAKKIKDKK